MQSASRPTQQQVREYMQQRQAEQTPPPPPDEIKRQLGWWLIPHNGAEGTLAGSAGA